MTKQSQENFWIVSPTSFEQHFSLEAAVKERDRLRKENNQNNPARGFRVYHCKRRLRDGHSSLYIGMLRRAIAMLMRSADPNSDGFIAGQAALRAMHNKDYDEDQEDGSVTTEQTQVHAQSR